MRSMAVALALAGAMAVAGCGTRARVEQAAADAQKASNSGDYRAAAADLNPVVEADSQDPQAYMAQAYAYFESGQNQQAIADVTRAVDLEPDAAIYRLARAYGYTRTGEFERALEDANDAVERAPHSSYCYSVRGYVYMTMGDSAKAIPDLTRALKEDPNSAVFMVQRGFAYGMAGRYGAAKQDFAAAIRTRPSYGASYSALAWLQATCPNAKYRDAKSAVENGKRGAQLGAPSLLAALATITGAQIKAKPGAGQDSTALAWSLDALAAAYAEAGQFDQAVAAQKQAIAHNRTAPNPLATKERKLLSLYQQGKPYRAGFDSLVPELPWISLPA